MNIALLIDDDRVARWQLAALRAIAPDARFHVFNCTNGAPRPRSWRHAFYYGLNLLSIRNPWTRQVPLPCDLPIASRADFDATIEGAWEQLPPEVVAQITRSGADIVLKFGMGLLRVPAQAELKAPILSYHHGDPRRFRGRPAGFYELVSGEHAMGQIIQILSDRLDAGAVVAFAETKIYPHSYRQTLMEAFRCSPLIIRTAIANARKSQVLPFAPTGRVYRLPTNGLVFRVVVRMAAALVRRLVYGALWEKVWRIASAELPPAGEIAIEDDTRWQEVATPRQYQFLADPFFEPASGAVLAEAMRSDGRGEIAILSGGSAERLAIDGGHVSYPATAQENGRTFFIPECAGWSSARLYGLEDGRAIDRGELAIAGRPRLIDPTPYVHSGRVYLFANRVQDGNGVLRLWVAKLLTSEFSEHPCSPICISPLGARMGGTPFTRDGDLYRPGQDLRGRYGDGIVLFRVEHLSPTDYLETPWREIRFTGRRGPHTLNMREDKALFDFYEERFSLLAGVRRLRRILPSCARR